jgi:hypothetical protein
MLPAELDIDVLIRTAIKHFWKTREEQIDKQGENDGTKDHGNRGAVTGGAQLDGFIELAKKIFMDNRVPANEIFDKDTTLPGFFRPTKDWDLLVVHSEQLVIAIEFKSQVGPSFGNNFNNRIEEALGSATDLWTAYREGTFPVLNKPWLGYFFLLEEHPRSVSPVKIHEPHYKVRKEFENSSYQNRYSIFCEKLMRERLYDAAAFLTSNLKTGKEGEYAEPIEQLQIKYFIKSMVAKIQSVYGCIT